MRHDVAKTLPHSLTVYPAQELMDEEYCTVLFRLQGGRPAIGELLLDLSQHFESSGTVEIVRVQVGDYLSGHPS
ncbi:hypothetical protein ACIPIN_08860 [Pseudomonas sp. NPDC087697]|uniref:hypothetical protein n=1 Tax=Pseudomonas sp. NPDC087697 TaxID=3364447 RepID=UPI0038076561